MSPGFKNGKFDEGLKRIMNVIISHIPLSPISGSSFHALGRRGEIGLIGYFRC
jgi:hypothetical protein